MSADFNTPIHHAKPEDYFRIPKFYSRADWGARVARKSRKTKQPVIYLVFKNTQTESCYSKDECMRIVRQLQRDAMDKDGKVDIEYNFLIGNDGTMYEGRGWDVAPDPFPDNVQDYTTEMNIRSVLIGMIGDSEDPRHEEKQEFSVLHLIGFACDKNLIHENVQFFKWEEVAPKRDRYDFD